MARRERGSGTVVIEAGAIAGYVIAWAVRKAKRVGDRLDTETDGVIDASLDKLHEAVAGKLGDHPVLAEIVEEAGEAGGNEGMITDLTRQQLELALTAAARKDEIFAQTVTELAVKLRDAEQAAGASVTAGPGSTVFTGKAEAKAKDGGVAVGQAGNVSFGGNPPDPPRPGRASH